MGIWNHIDWQLLQDVEDLQYYGILDEERDAELIGTMEAIAHETPVTPEQQALFDAHIDALMEDLDEQRRMEELVNKISKDD